VLGGLGTLTGALWGALVIVLVPTYVTDVATSHGLSGGVAANIPIAAYGVVLIIVMLVFPYGIQGGLRRLAGQFLPTSPTRPGSPGQRAPAGEHAEDLDSPYRRPPVSEHQEEGTS
jgi:branched-chain amino acid transport system permease protein